MKIFIPRNVEAGRFNVSVSLWPLQISLVQMILLASWLWLSVVIWNTLTTNGLVERGVALMISLPILFIFVLIAFFKVSELSLLPFIAKSIRTYVIDTTRKFQLNYNRPDPVAVSLAQFRKTDHEYEIETKEYSMNTEKLRKLTRITES